MMTDFFAEFPAVSKEAWLRQIAKDLNDRPLEELDWQIADDFKVSPFVHADDFSAPPAPFSSAPNDWEICENVFVTDPVAANRQALDALEGGAEGLRFHFEIPPNGEVFQQVFEKIHLDFIGVHFAGAGIAANPGVTLAHLEHLAKESGIPTQHLRGSLGYDPAASGGIVDWRYLADLLKFAREKFPNFKIITPSSLDAIQPIEELGELLRKGNLYLEKLTERGISAIEAADTLQFSMTVGKSYFLEIAKIRAFKLLWLNVLKAWGVPLNYHVVEVNFRPETYTDEIYTNMIRATTMAMSAVLGGAERLTVLPYDAGREGQATYSQAFSRRIARNVQHLLKMEGFFNEITDPAAGSYYIEKLTEQVAEKVWEKFQNSR